MSAEVKKNKQIIQCVCIAAFAERDPYRRRTTDCLINRLSVASLSADAVSQQDDRASGDGVSQGEAPALETISDALFSSLVSEMQLIRVFWIERL